MFFNYKYNECNGESEIIISQLHRDGDIVHTQFPRPASELE